MSVASPARKAVQPGASAAKATHYEAALGAALLKGNFTEGQAGKAPNGTVLDWNELIRKWGKHTGGSEHLSSSSCPEVPRPLTCIVRYKVDTSLERYLTPLCCADLSSCVVFELRHYHSTPSAHCFLIHWFLSSGRWSIWWTPHRLPYSSSASEAQEIKGIPGKG